MNDKNSLEPTEKEGWTIPDHVPQELVIDVDQFNLPGGDKCPHQAWKAFIDKEKGALVWSPYHGGHWVATDPHDIQRIQRDAKNFSSSQGSVPKRGSGQLVPLEADPPEHKDYRGNLLPLFTGKTLAAMAPAIRALAVELVEGLKDKGGCDFIHDFALLFPVGVVLDILGLPREDGLYLNQLAETVARHPDPVKKKTAYVEIEAYVAKFVDARLENPKDDGITAITQAKVLGRPYARDEMIRSATQLTLGGVDSVAMHHSFIALYLARNPEQQKYIRENLDNLDQVVNEFARRYPISNRMRLVANDIELHGVKLKKGDMIGIPAPIHNLDEELYPNGAEIDFHRPKGTPHLSFGTGIHVCAGAALARLETEIFLQEWFQRIPEIQLMDGKEPKVRAASLSAVDDLWLQWPVDQ